MASSRSSSRRMTVLELMAPPEENPSRSVVRPLLISDGMANGGYLLPGNDRAGPLWYRRCKPCGTQAPRSSAFGHCKLGTPRLKDGLTAALRTFSSQIWGVIAGSIARRLQNLAQTPCCELASIGSAATASG